MKCACSTPVRAIAFKYGKWMFKFLARCALLSLALLPATTAAEPIKLKLAYFSSDREPPYIAVLKPFADAVNKEAKGVLEIQLYPLGVLGRSYAEQPQLVLDGTADMAWVNPSLTPKLFTDSAVMQLPSLFRDLNEATMAHTGIVGTLNGYEKFFVIGSFANYPLMIHTRSPIATLGDLRGKKIRANSLIEVKTLDALGIESVVLPINEIARAISQGVIDGTTMPPGSLFDYGISRLTKYLYVSPIGAAPLNFLMNRERFESLPTAGRDAIRKFSGGWTAARFVDAYGARNNAAMAQLESDPLRTVIFPSQAELEAARDIFRAVVQTWSAMNPRHSELLRMTELEIGKLRETR
jgi:TRAP-type C4-dicarboxylate transport system substrate-binding protein